MDESRLAITRTLVAEAHKDPEPSRFAMLKVLYLLAVTAVAFAMPAFEATRPATKLVPNLIAGTLSGYVTAFVLRAFAQPDPSPAPEKDGELVHPLDEDHIESPSAQKKDETSDVVRRTGGTV